MKKDFLVIVRGGGDLATGCIHRLWSATAQLAIVKQMTGRNRAAQLAIVKQMSRH